MTTHAKLRKAGYSAALIETAELTPSMPFAVALAACQAITDRHAAGDAAEADALAAIERSRAALRAPIVYSWES